MKITQIRRVIFIAIIALLGVSMTSCASRQVCSYRKAAARADIGLPRIRTDLPVSSQVANIPRSMLQCEHRAAFRPVEIKKDIEVEMRVPGPQIKKATHEFVPRKIAAIKRQAPKELSQTKMITVRKATAVRSKFDITVRKPEAAAKAHSVQAIVTHDLATQPATLHGPQAPKERTLRSYAWCLKPAQRMLAQFWPGGRELPQVAELVREAHPLRFDLRKWIPKLPDDKRIIDMVTDTKKRNCLAGAFGLADILKDRRVRIVVGDHYTKLYPNFDVLGDGKEYRHAWLEWHDNDEGYILDCTLSDHPIPYNSPEAANYTPLYKASFAAVYGKNGESLKLRQRHNVTGQRLAAR